MKNHIIIFNLNSYSIFNQSNKKASIWWSEVDAYNFAKYLKSRWYKVIVLVWDFWQEAVEYKEWVVLVKTIKVENNWIIKWIFNMLKLLYFFYKYRWYIYFFEAASHYLWIWYIFCKLFRRKLVFRTAHDRDCNWEFIKNNWIIWKIYKLWLYWSDIILTQNKENQEMLLTTYWLKSFIIKNFFNIKKKSILSYSERKYFLWVARWDTRKKPEYFLEIVSRNPQYDFLMICPKVNDDTYYKDIEFKAKSLNNLRFIEKVPYFDIQKFFDKAICFIWTSDYEWFPNTYIQACLSSTPIISLKVNPNKFITENKLWYVCNWDLDLLNEKLNFINDQKQWGIRSSNALKYAYNNHSDKIEWKKLVTLFKKL